MNKLDLIPGERIIDDSFRKIQRLIVESMNPLDIDSYERFQEYILMSTQETIDKIYLSHYQKYYLLFEYFTDSNQDRLYIVEKIELIQYIAECFDEEYGDGLDITVANMLYQALFLGNHDGMLMKIPEADF